jgi:hypothetical protein
MSVITESTEVVLSAKSHDEITAALVTLSKSSNADTVRTAGAMRPKHIQNHTLLGSMHASDAVHNVGSVLFRDVITMVRLCGPEFYDVVVGNFDLAKARDACGDAMKVHQDEAHECHLTMERHQPAYHPEIFDKKKSIQLQELRAQRAVERAAVSVPVVEGDPDASVGVATRTRAAGPTSPVPASAGAPTHDAALAAFDLETEMLAAAALLASDKQAVAAYEVHLQSQQETTNARMSLKSVMRRIEELNVLMAYLALFMDLASHCSSKIRSVVPKFPLLQASLSTTVVLPHTGECIDNPYDANHLPGTLYLLEQKFRKPNFVYLAGKVHELMNWKLAPGEPILNAVGQVERMLHTWTRDKLYEQLSKDVLFALIFANGFPFSTAVRKAAVDAILEELSALSNHTSKYAADPMPVFRATTKAVEDHAHAQKFNATGVANSPVPQAAAPAGAAAATTPTTEYYRTPRYRSRGTVESAAAADVSAADLHAAQAQATERYTGEILKRDGKKCVINDRIHAYVAVRHQTTVCAGCYGNPATPCKPRPCFCVQCDKCKYYGHRAAVCRQSTTVEGKKIP